MNTSNSPAATLDLARVVLAVLGIGALLAGSLSVLKPFIGSLLWATMIVVSTWPMMIAVQGWAGGRRGAAVAVMTLALLLVLFVPLGLAVATVLEQSDRAMELARALPTARLPSPPAWVATMPLLGGRLAARWAEVSALSPDQRAQLLGPYLRDALAWFAASAGTLGGMVVHFLLTVVLSAILFARGEAGAAQVLRFFRRLSGHRGDVIVSLAGKAIRAVALGIVVTALIQTAIAAAGLFAASAPGAGVVAAIVFVLCIAQLGPLLALLPFVIWLYATGAAGRATVLLVAMVLAQVVDNFIRPVLIKRGADLSLLLVFPGVVGGLLWLGIIGLFIGPVVLAVTATLLEDWISMGLGEAAPGAPPAEAGPAAATPAPAPAPARGAAGL